MATAIFHETDDELRARVEGIATREQLAGVLDVSYDALTYWAWRVGDDHRYTTFEVPRRSGGTRKISAPVNELRRIQRRLNRILRAFYEPKAAAHGFTRRRDIVSNAARHVGRKFVLNVDLNDFFPSIHFGRVRGVLLKEPFTLPEPVATLVAQLCCVRGALPQGAPTSPVLSNFVCRRLDTALSRLAKRYGCVYTRYADDLTFSCNLDSFPHGLATLPYGAPPKSVQLSADLVEAITANDFRINDAKSRLTTHGRERQEVTGLVVNEVLNVKRTYVRQVRAMLHAWRKFGYEAAQRTYREKYKGHRRGLPEFRKVVRGKLAFLGQIRGRNDPTYCGLFQQYAGLDDQYHGPLPVPAPRYAPSRDLHGALWVVHSLREEGRDVKIEQGTAFLLDGVGLVTCAHVLGDAVDVTAHRSETPEREYKVEVVSRDDARDLAVLRLPGEALVGSRSLRASRSPRRAGVRVTVAGYPNHNHHDSIHTAEGNVTQFRIDGLERRFLVSAWIIFGMSGGPVLDQQRRVVGIAARGAASEAEAAKTENHSVIPIEAVERIGAAAHDR